jgi:hypothetical protein
MFIHIMSEGFDALIGTIILWFKNKGKKSFRDLWKQNSNISHVGYRFLLHFMTTILAVSIILVTLLIIKQFY